LQDIVLENYKIDYGIEAKEFVSGYSQEQIEGTFLNDDRRACKGIGR